MAKYHVFAGDLYDITGGMAEYKGFMTAEKLKAYIVDYEAGDVVIVDQDGELEKVGEWNTVMDMNDKPTTLHIFTSTGVVPELSKLDGEYFFTAGNN